MVVRTRQSITYTIQVLVLLLVLVLIVFHDDTAASAAFQNSKIIRLYQQKQQQHECHVSLLSTFDCWTSTNKCDSTNDYRSLNQQQKQSQKQKTSWRQRYRHVSMKTRNDDDDESSCINSCDRIYNQHKGNYDNQKEVDINNNRREVLFAMIGTVWSITSPYLVSTTLIATTTTTTPQLAYGEYGADAKMFIPNPYDTLNDRVTKKCLVESLGNRECLVYADDANFLYTGTPDSQLLVDRITKASIAFGTVPELVATKKWIQITSVLTGPMGELIKTMGQLADLSTQSVQQSKDLIKLVKNDLYAISDGITRKDQAIVLKYHAKATTDLVAFIKSL